MEEVCVGSTRRQNVRCSQWKGVTSLRARLGFRVGIMLLGISLFVGGTLSAAERGPCDAERAEKYLKTVCEIGPRISGTEGMRRQQELIRKHFEQFNAEMFSQEFDVPHPETGAPVRLNNLFVSWHPKSTERVLLACHYDTRPYPDKELLPANRKKPFIGANDGGSGVALFMELGHHMRKLNPSLGVDFVFFDAEEFIFDSKRDKFFLGSTQFARSYRDQPPAFRYAWGVLVDMVADKDLKIFMEKNSRAFAPELTESIWASAKKVGASEFVPRVKHDVQDDHIPLNKIANIPSCDLVDMDYPHWHTRNDIPSACSGRSLQTVGNVLLRWLTEIPPPRH